MWVGRDPRGLYVSGVRLSSSEIDSSFVMANIRALEVLKMS